LVTSLMLRVDTISCTKQSHPHAGSEPCAFALAWSAYRGPRREYPRSYSMKTTLALLIVILAGSLGDVFIAKGMKRVGEIATLRLRELAVIGTRMVCNAAFLLGILCLAISFGAFLVVLSWADLSFIVPATSLSFVVSTLGAKWFLQERIDRLRWLGTILVCVGVALLSLP